MNLLAKKGNSNVQKGREQDAATPVHQYKFYIVTDLTVTGDKEIYMEMSVGESFHSLLTALRFHHQKCNVHAKQRIIKVSQKIFQFQ